VTYTIHLAPTHHLIYADLSRFAYEAPTTPGSPANPRRRFVVSPASLARASDNGFSPALLAHWYVKRTGAEMPPAVRLLLMAAGGRPSGLSARRPLVLEAPSPQWLDGLLQHPATRRLLAERLGPTAVVIPEDSLDAFRRALLGLGLSVELEPKPHE
jgi:hypothetical protein